LINLKDSIDLLEQAINQATIAAGNAKNSGRCPNGTVLAGIEEEGANRGVRQNAGAEKSWDYRR